MEQATGEPRPDGVETREVGFFAAAELPLLSGGHQIVVPQILGLVGDATAPPFFRSGVAGGFGNGHPQSRLGRTSRGTASR